MSEKTIVVIPCYNEGKRLRIELFAAFVRLYPDVRFLFVDDGSTDNTAALLSSLASELPAAISGLSLEKNSGKAEAVRQGLLAAMATEATFAAYWDADLATPLDELPRFIATLDAYPKCDLVMGARVKLLGRDVERNALRHYMGRVFATAASLTLKLPVYDTQCGAKLIRNSPAMRQVLSTPFSSRWIFDVELIARMGAHSAPDTSLAHRIIELPLKHWRDVKGSKVKAWDFVTALRELMSIRNRYRLGAKAATSTTKPALSPRHARWFLAALLLMQLVLHAPMLNQAPVGQHVWRQVVGYAAARAYFEEEPRFFYPRSDIRLNAGDSGVIYHELPITYWLTGLSYRWFGEQNITARLIPLLFNLLLIPGLFILGRALGYGERRALWLTFFASFSPLFFYYAPSFEPNMLGLSFFVWGLAATLYATKDTISWQKKLGRFVAGAVMLSLATLAKPTYLFFGLPLLGVALSKLRRPWSQRYTLAGLAAVGLCVLASNALVLRHAKQLYEASPLQRQIHTPIGPAESPESWSSLWRNIEAAASKWFFEMNVNLAALPFFALGVYALWRSRAWRSASGRFWLWWCASLAVFTCFFVMRFADHDYYITASLPLAAVISSYGAFIWSASHRHALLRQLLLVAVVIVAVLRGYGRWVDHPQVPLTLRQQAAAISDFIPEDDLILVQGDPTPVVYLYYLHRKGLSLDTAALPFPSSDEELHAFKWLVQRQTAHSEPHPSVQEHYRLTKKGQVEDFIVYALQPKAL